MHHCCKVGKLISRYDLRSVTTTGDINEYMIQRWIGQSEYSETGLRPLKDWFNKQLLKTTYTEHDRTTRTAIVESDYNGLQEDNNMAILEDLEANGIDGEQLQSDFISTATLYRHLTDCLDATKSKQSSDTDWETDKLEYAQNVVTQSVEEALQSLETKGELPEASDARIKTEVILGCPECATQISFERAISRGYVCPDHMREAGYDED